MKVPKEDFEIYNPKNHEDLDDIAKLYGLSSEQLRVFHNTRCEEKDTISILQILIPKELYVPLHTLAQAKELNKRKRPPQKFNQKIWTAEYEVKENINNQNLTYTLSLNFENSESQTFVSLHKKNFVYEESKMSNLNIKLAKAIYPLKFSIKTNGKLNSLVNFNQIYKQLNDKPTDSSNKFAGAKATHYVETLNTIAKNKERTENFIINDLAFQILFLNLDWFWQESNWQENFYLVDKEKPNKCVFEITQDFNRVDFLKTTIFIKALPTEETIYYPNASLKIIYKTDLDSHLIKEIIAEKVSKNGDKEIRQSIIIKKLNYEQA